MPSAVYDGGHTGWMEAIMSSISGPIGDDTSANEDLDGAVTETGEETSAEMDRRPTDDQGEAEPE